MRPAVMRHLVAALYHRLARTRMALDREAGDEPGRTQAECLEQIEDAARADEPEFAARQRRRRGHAARDQPGLGVEIEGEADDVARQRALPGVDTTTTGIA